MSFFLSARILEISAPEKAILEMGCNRMASSTYLDPVVQLLTLGELDNDRPGAPWPDYLELGLNHEHVPDLIRMSTDMELSTSGWDSLEVWAPLHAWRTLGQLQAKEATEPLVGLFEQLEDYDWIPSELPKVFSMIGPSTIPALATFLGNDAVKEDCRLMVPRCLERIAEKHPAHRDECIRIMASGLERYDTNGPRLNAFIISSLIDLHAIETIDLIREAFAAGRVDLIVAGDIEDVEIEMGLRTQRSTPPADPNPFATLLGLDDREIGHNILEQRVRKVGRNEPCPCGSGKKYKKCCLH